MSRHHFSGLLKWVQGKGTVSSTAWLGGQHAQACTQKNAHLARDNLNSCAALHQTHAGSAMADACTFITRMRHSCACQSETQCLMTHPVSDEPPSGKRPSWPGWQWAGAHWPAAVSTLIMQLSLQTRIPVIQEVATQELEARSDTASIRSDTVQAAMSRAWAHQLAAA